MTEAPPAAKVRPLVVGANHRSSSMALRDRLFVEDPLIPGFLARLKAGGVEQAMILSTCDRVEVITVHADVDAAARTIVEALARQAGVEGPSLSGQLYRMVDTDAVRQVFAVASSLDSLVVGEPQVLGQLKAAHRLAADAGLVGPELDALMQAAYGAAKRIRTETRIGEGPVSIAAAAVQIARDLHGDLDRSSALLIGAGDMGDLVGHALLEAKVGHLTVTHPVPARAQTAARTLDCHKADFETLPELLEKSDIVLTSVNGRGHVLSADMVQIALKARRRRPIFLIDAGIPGDVEPAVNRIEDAFLYDLNDLERVAMAGRAGRESEARAAREILEAEIAAYRKGRAERVGAPAVVALRSRFEQERERVLAEAGNDAEKATHLLINRLLHDPSEVTREMAAYGQQGGALGADEWDATQRALIRLFRLDGDNKDAKR